MKWPPSIPQRLKIQNPTLHVVFRYLLAISWPVAACLFSIVMRGTIGPVTAPVLFALATALSAWNGGNKAGLLAAILSTIFLNYFFLLPGNVSFIVIQNLVFFLSLAIIILLVGAEYWHAKLDFIRSENYDLKIRIKKLEISLKAAQKEIKSRDEFLSVASHELKTPLTSMLLQTQTAIHNIKNVSLAHFSIDHLLKMLESVENQTRRLSKMINDLLNISLITTGNLELELDKFDMDTLIKEVLTDFSARIEQKNYKVAYKNHESVRGFWDKVRIEQAISNLLSNAIKYGNQNPIIITLERHGRNAEIKVIDHGIGIPKQEQKRIFGLFERAVPDGNIKGLGVGLYITHKIVTAHNGTINLESKEGQGTTFTLSLPRELKKASLK